MKSKKFIKFIDWEGNPIYIQKNKIIALNHIVDDGGLNIHTTHKVLSVRQVDDLEALIDSLDPETPKTVGEWQ